MGRLGISARVVVAAAGVGVAAGALAIADGPGRSTTYAGRSAGAAALTLGAGLCLIVAGVVLALGRGQRRVGDLALLAGVTSFAPVWIAWHSGPPLFPSLAMVLAGFTFPLVLHLVLAHTAGGRTAGPARALVVVVYAEAVLAAVLLALFRNPYFDSSCWANCNVNSFRIRSLPSLTDAVDTTDRWFVAAAATALAATLLMRLLGATRVARIRLVPVAVPALVFAGAVVARAVALQRTTIEDPFDTALYAIFALACCAVILLSAGLTLSALRSGIERRAVEHVVASLGAAPTPGTLEGALRAALHDDALRVAYWLPDAERYVDARGEPVPEPPRSGRRHLTKVTRGGRTVAVVSHSEAVSDLKNRLGPAIRLGLENEQLQAEVLAQLNELRRSRGRIVENADSERRRLERDLHDGAQQRLLALSYELRLARASAEEEGDISAEQALIGAIEMTQSALGDLRDLAHGIYPAVLTDAGLAAALETLADTARVRVDLDGLNDRRRPSTVEAAAYFAVVEALDDAAMRDARRVAVKVLQADGRLGVTVEDDGSERSASMVALADRIGALGGTVDVGPTTLHAEIPCA